MTLRKSRRDANQNKALRILARAIHVEPIGPRRDELIALQGRGKDGLVGPAEIMDAIYPDSKVVEMNTHVSQDKTNQVEQPDSKVVEMNTHVSQDQANQVERPTMKLINGQSDYSYPPDIAAMFGKGDAVRRPYDGWWGTKQGREEARKRVMDFKKSHQGNLPTVGEAQTELGINGYLKWYKEAVPYIDDEKIIKALGSSHRK